VNTELNIVEITSLEDDLLLPWLDLFETAFPPHEKVLVSNHLQAIKMQARGEDIQEHFLAALDDHHALTGMARYQLFPETRAAFLWYLATTLAARNLGLGGKIYDHILSIIDPSQYQVMFLEVEMPEEAENEALRLLAKRRIGFYRRHGAVQLNGIHYLQTVGPHQPQTPMHILVHPFQPEQCLPC
jgi:ribosomal protein S18 acetylase RimI-like enzyme